MSLLLSLLHSGLVQANILWLWQLKIITSLARNLDSRQLYPPVSEHVNLYKTERDVCCCCCCCFFRVEQKRAILVHMNFVLSDKM